MPLAEDSVPVQRVVNRKVPTGEKVLVFGDRAARLRTPGNEGKREEDEEKPKGASSFQAWQHDWNATDSPADKSPEVEPSLDGSSAGGQESQEKGWLLEREKLRRVKRHGRPPNRAPQGNRRGAAT